MKNRQSVPKVNSFASVTTNTLVNRSRGGLVVLLLRRFHQIAFVLLASCAALAQQLPSITAMSPNPGGIGQSVTITGVHFGSAGNVKFNGVQATTTSWTSTAIVATVPTGITAPVTVVVTVAGHSSSAFSFALNNGPVNYFYDDLGRLVGVIDVNGNAAEYSYDIVGNIQTIGRFTSAQASIINFTPDTGPVGTAVTINGTGFSTTPSQNTVTFYGASAAVTSATNTTLQVIVPSSASSGPISVTSPNGSVTSTAGFTVTSTNGVPTITSFTPPSGMATNSVTIIGTNFDPTPANDKLRLNASQAPVGSVTSTTITTTVPANTASGHFSLIAPAGNAVSAQDFYVPFGTHVPGDIGFTARIQSNGSETVSLGSNQIALILFDAVQGQYIDIQMSGSTLSPCTLYLIAPNGSTPATSYCTSSYSDIGATYLPQTGTYTIGIDPGTSAPGSITVTLSSDVIGTIAINGPPVTVATTATGQDARLNFVADPGQRVVAYATNVTNPNALLSLVLPNGNTTSRSIAIYSSQPSQTFFMDTQNLTAGGAYQLWVQHSGAYFGSETLQLNSVPPDFTGTLTVPAAGATGTAVAVPTTGALAVGQNAYLTFQGSTGQQLSFNVVNSTIGTAATSCLLSLTDPNGNGVSISNSSCGVGANPYVDTVILDASGTFTMLVNPVGTATGSISGTNGGISINNAQNVTTPPISIGGGFVTATTTVPGQDVRLSFTPSSSQRIAVLIKQVTNPEATVNLWNPTTQQTIESIGINDSPPSQQFFLDTESVTGSQTYQLWVQHYGANYGSETMEIGSVPADITHTVTVGGASYQFTTSMGQNAYIQFSINSTENIVVSWTNGTYASSPGCLLTVTGPSPATTQVGSGSCTGGTGNVTMNNLSPGAYTIFVNPTAQETGGMTLSVAQ